MSDCSCEACGYELEIGDVKCGGCGAECDPDETRGFKLERTITRGNTVILDLCAQNPFTKTAPDSESAGFKAIVTIRQNLSDKVAAFVGSFEEGEVVDQGGGRFLVTIPSSVTYTFPDGVVKLYYDVVFVEDGQTWTQEKGLFKVKPGVASYLDPIVQATRKTPHAEHGRDFPEAFATGLTDVELYAWGRDLENGQALRLDFVVTAVRDDGSAADGWAGFALYRKSAGTLVLANGWVSPQGVMPWVVAIDPGAPRLTAHSAAAVNARFTARVEWSLVTG